MLKCMYTKSITEEKMWGYILLDSFSQQAIKTGSDGPHVLGKAWTREKWKSDLIPEVGQSRQLYKWRRKMLETVPALNSLKLSR